MPILLASPGRPLLDEKCKKKKRPFFAYDERRLRPVTPDVGTGQFLKAGRGFKPPQPYDKERLVSVSRRLCSMFRPSSLPLSRRPCAQQHTHTRAGISCAKRETSEVKPRVSSHLISLSACCFALPGSLVFLVPLVLRILRDALLPCSTASLVSFGLVSLSLPFKLGGDAICFLLLHTHVPLRGSEPCTCRPHGFFALL